jgi:hypothetical protein
LPWKPPVASTTARASLDAGVGAEGQGAGDSAVLHQQLLQARAAHQRAAARLDGPAQRVGHLRSAGGPAVAVAEIFLPRLQLHAV